MANIVDFIRASLTFDTVKDLLKGLKRLDNLIKSKKSGCIIEILRIKNGFSDIKDWKRTTDANYKDVKLNIVIHDTQSGQSIIGEIQLLLNWLEHAKHIGHKLYGIKRKEELVDTIKNIRDNEENHFNCFNRAYDEMTGDNREYFNVEFSMRPNIVLSQIDYGMPYFNYVHCQGYRPKLWKLWWAAMNHYSNTYFENGNIIQSEKQSFLTKYLNYIPDGNRCNYMTDWKTLWGSHIARAKNDPNSATYNELQTIMSCKYYHGLVSVKYILLNNKCIYTVYTVIYCMSY